MSSSPAIAFCEEVYGELDEEQIIEQLDPLEAAAIAYDWEGWWARPEQLIPVEGEWLTWGFLTGRGFGKTCAVSNFVVREAKAGRAMRIALCAQSDEEAFKFQVAGESGLLAESPPWFPATWEEKRQRVVWPNGSQAFVYTPHAPGAIRGPEHHLVWTSEVVAWPKTTRSEALMNLEHGCRIGYARSVWDTTPKRRDDVVREYIRESNGNPWKHVVVQGTTDDNRHNLNPERLEQLHSKYDGTQKGAEELGGHYSDDDEGALWKQGWIDNHRRDAPAQLRRRIVIVDPAISKRRQSDETGISELGLGLDDQVYVFGDYTKKYGVEEWGDVVLDLYVSGRCDCVVVERNRGGDLVAGMLRARGQTPERVAAGTTLTVQVVDADAVTRHVPRVVYVKEVHAYKSKQERAEPVAALYESGHISHVIGARLAELEDLMCTWVPDQKTDSPDRLDPMVWGVWELRGLARQTSPAQVPAAHARMAQAELKARVSSGGPSPLSARGSWPGWRGSRL